MNLLVPKFLPSALNLAEQYEINNEIQSKDLKTSRLILFDIDIRKKKKKGLFNIYFTKYIF